MLGVFEGLHGRLAVAVPSTVWPLLIVVGDPFIQIVLQLFDRLANLLSESDLVELLENRLVEAFADSVGLSSPPESFVTHDDNSCGSYGEFAGPVGRTDQGQ